VKQQKGSVSKTLMEVYPDIGLDERKFGTMTRILFSPSLPLSLSSPSSSLPPLPFSSLYLPLKVNIEGYWHDPKNKRKFFDNVAAKQGFNPLNPENWYSLEYSAILNEKVFFSPFLLLIFCLLLHNRVGTQL
jgi:hypothetical protein